MNIKEHLAGKSKDSLIREIITLSKKFQNVHDYYSDLSGNSNEVLEDIDSPSGKLE